MTIGASLFLLVTGAILAFAVDVRTRGIDLATVGVILMIFGLVGLLVEVVWWSDRRPRREVDLLDHDDDVVLRRRGRVVTAEPMETVEPLVERRRVTVTRDGPPY
jgi:hypothetical protein